MIEIAEFRFAIFDQCMHSLWRKGNITIVLPVIDESNVAGAIFLQSYQQHLQRFSPLVPTLVIHHTCLYRLYQTSLVPE